MTDFDAPYAIAQAILAEVAGQLLLAGADLPSMQYVVNSDLPAWDNCCDDNGVGGQLSVAMAPLNPIDQRGMLGQAATGYPISGVVPRVMATFRVDLLRCDTTTIDSQGSFPSADTITAAAMVTMRDMAAVYQALLLVVASRDFEGTSVSAGPQGPAGGCMGVYGLLTLELTADMCPGWS